MSSTEKTKGTKVTKLTTTDMKKETNNTENSSHHETDSRRDTEARQRPRLVKDLSASELRDERQKLMNRIVDLFNRIMLLPYPTTYYWHGTLSDLIELTHNAWLTGEFTDSQGRPLTFSAMAANVCRLLHCRHVASPYALVDRAKNRKGVRGMPVIDRYIKLVVEGHLQNPMYLDLKHFRGPDSTSRVTA